MQNEAPTAVNAVPFRPLQTLHRGVWVDVHTLYREGSSVEHTIRDLSFDEHTQNATVRQMKTPQRVSSSNEHTKTARFI